MGLIDRVAAKYNTKAKNLPRSRTRGGKNMVDVVVSVPDNLEEMLAEINAGLRETVLKQALTEAGDIVAEEAKKHVTAPGYKGDKTLKDPKLKPLRDSIKSVVRRYGNRVVCLVGPEYSGPYRGGANHAHLVEFGHQLVKKGANIGFVPAKPFLRPAALSTKSQQQAAIVKRLREAAQ